MKAGKIILPVSIIAGIAVIGAAVAALSNSAANVSYADTIQIQQKELENKISVSGTVASAEKTNVYARLNYPVEKINVSVGDAVKKGDVLCTINTEDLQQQILQQQAAVESSGISSDYTLSEAEQRYADALADYQNGDNTALVNAKKVIEQAEKALDDAKRQEKLGTEMTLPTNIENADTQIKNASSQVESAELAYESAKSSYENSVKEYDDAEKALKPENYPASTKAVYDKLEEYKGYLNTVENDKFNNELEHAKNVFEKAQKEYYDIMESGGKDLYSSDYIEKITDNYTKAKAEYEAAVKKFDKDNLKQQIKEYETQLNSAVESLERARDSAKIAVDSAKTAMDNAKLNLDNAKSAYDRAVSDYDSAGKQNDNTAESYSIAVKNAQDALDTAKRDYELAVQQVEAELSSLKKQAEQQRTISGLNDPQVIILQNYKDKLEYAVITAPCDGIITAVNAEEGAIATGPLFVIEDLENLVITASVGEYDIPYIDEGMEAVIRCDALDGSEYSGKITDVAPTSSVTAAGNAASYKIEASIEGGNGKLFTGMSAKLNIISERKAGALTVTYDALATDDDGNDVIYIAEKDESGVYHARMIPVTVGLETDYEIEVISSELKDGMYALTNTALLSDGAIVNINETENEVQE